MNVTEIVSKLKKVGMGSAISGMVLVGGKYVYENFGLVHKYLGYARNCNEAILPLTYGLIGSVVGLPGSEESLVVGIAKGLDGVMDAFVLKKPFAYAKDASTIEAFNLDANSAVEVYVDGSKVSFTTPPTTDSNGNVVITLPSPMSAGRHDVIVKTSVKAWAGSVAV